MEFRQIRYVASALEHRSMSAGARACGVSQPSLSDQIRRVEAELDRPLFERDTRGLRPTPAGVAAYRDLGPVLQAAEHGMRYLRAGESRLLEDLRVHVAGSGASRLYEMMRRAVRTVEDGNRHLRVFQSGIEHGAPVRGASALHLRHFGRDAACVRTDEWLLVTANGDHPDDENDASLVGSSDEELEVLVPAGGLRDDMVRWCRGRHPALVIVEGETESRVGHLLARSRGRVLVPALSVGSSVLDHPRLRSRVVDIGFPLGIGIEAEGRATRWHSALRDAIAADKAGSIDTGPMPIARQWRYFLRCCEAGSMTRAAAGLNIVQPALTMQIRALERSVGAILFHRHSHGLQLTETGLRARAIFAPLLAALHAQASPKSHRPGRTALRVGVLPGIDEDSLIVQATTAAVIDWQTSFPTVDLEIVEAHSGILLDWLADDIIDVAMVEDMHARSSFEHQLLSSEPLSLLTNAGDAFCAAGPVRMKDITALNLVMPSASHGLRALLDRTFRRSGLTLAPKLQLDSMAAAIRLVKAGNWVTVLPASAVRRGLAEGALSAHLIIEPAIDRELRAVRVASSTKRIWADRFVRVLQSRLDALSPGSTPRVGERTKATGRGIEQADIRPSRRR